MGGKGSFWDDSSALHLLWTLFRLLLCQLHLRSLGIRSWRLGTPGLEGINVGSEWVHPLGPSLLIQWWGAQQGGLEQGPLKAERLYQQDPGTFWNVIVSLRHRIRHILQACFGRRREARSSLSKQERDGSCLTCPGGFTEAYWFLARQNSPGWKSLPDLNAGLVNDLKGHSPFKFIWRLDCKILVWFLSGPLNFLFILFIVTPATSSTTVLMAPRTHQPCCLPLSLLPVLTVSGIIFISALYPLALHSVLFFVLLTQSEIYHILSISALKQKMLLGKTEKSDPRQCQPTVSAEPLLPTGNCLIFQSR